MAQATSSAQAAAEATAKHEAVWHEIVNALPTGSVMYNHAFSQLQGAAKPFQAAIEIAAALPQEGAGLRQRSQGILRIWAAREASCIKASQEKEERQAANRQERKEKQMADLLERNVQRAHELELLRLGPKKKKKKKMDVARTPKTKTKAKVETPTLKTPTAAGSGDGDDKSPPTMYMAFKTEMLKTDPEMTLPDVKAKWKKMKKKERKVYLPDSPRTKKRKKRKTKQESIDRGDEQEKVAVAPGTGPPTRYIAFKTEVMSTYPEMTLPLVRAKWKSMDKEERDAYKPDAAAASTTPRKKTKAKATTSSLSTPKAAGSGDGDDNAPNTMYMAFKSEIMSNNPEMTLADVKAKWKTMKKKERKAYTPGSNRKGSQKRQRRDGDGSGDGGSGKRRAVAATSDDDAGTPDSA